MVGDRCRNPKREKREKQKQLTQERERVWCRMRESKESPDSKLTHQQIQQPASKIRVRHPRGSHRSIPLSYWAKTNHGSPINTWASELNRPNQLNQAQSQLESTILHTTHGRGSKMKRRLPTIKLIWLKRQMRLRL